MKLLSRRQLLTRSFLASSALFVPKTVLAIDRPPLTIPPLLNIGKGRPLPLILHSAQTQFEQGKLVDVWGVNGQYLAPTVRVKSGDFVKINYRNDLPQPISMFIQGLMAPTDMVGGKHKTILPNQNWSPIIHINQPACTCWYHADTMLNSAYQLYRGLAGLWIIEDNDTKTAHLPQKYGVDDIPLILQDQHINHEGKQLLDTSSSQFFGKRLFTNGKASPYLNVPRTWIRLRLVNASLSRAYDIQLDNGKPFSLIATGVGMFAEPIDLHTYTLAPSERIEILINLTDETEAVSLISGKKRNIVDRVQHWFSDENELADNVILELRPEGLVSLFNNKPQLPAFDLTDFTLSIAKERKLIIRPLDRLINQQRFDPNRIDFTIKKGTVERWIITSNENIGFTLQGAKFIVETRAAKNQAIKTLAWRDTLWLKKDQQVTLLVRFEQASSPALPFSFGVSDFMLADKGCLGQFVVE